MLDFEDYGEDNAATFKTIFSAFILVMGGMNMSWDVNAKDVILLAIPPLIIETGLITLSSFYLTDLELKWALVLGLIIAPVGIGITLGKLYELKTKGIGSKNNIP